MAAAEIEIHVVYALPSRQPVVSLRVSAGTTAVDAVRQSGLLSQHPEIALDTVKLGIYGRRVAPDHAVSAGDRVEIYRPLTADPKAVRRERAERSKSAGRPKPG